MATKKTKKTKRAKSVTKTRKALQKTGKTESVQKITPFLWFDGNAEEAIQYYISTFKKSKIVSVNRLDGKIFTATFRLNGQEFMAINGGPQFKFTEAVSFFIKCKSQSEIDELWDKLSDGGTEQMCGWLKDRFGVSWQVIPEDLGKYLHHKDPERSQRAMQALLQMRKINVQKLKDAFAGK